MRYREGAPKMGTVRSAEGDWKAKTDPAQANLNNDAMVGAGYVSGPPEAVAFRKGGVVAQRFG
ncbi:hypothetical protein GCM10027594_22500 [Hymenobacter agri]